MSELCFRNGDTLDKRLRSEIKRVKSLNNLSDRAKLMLQAAEAFQKSGTAMQCLRVYNELREVTDGQD
jgi:hypothetical protein